MADRLDAHVGTVAIGNRANEFDRVGCCGVADMSRSKLLGPLELAVIDVDGDDRRCAGQLGAGDCSVAHTTAAEHGNRVPVPHPTGVDCGADSRHHAAPEQPGD